MFFPTSFKIPEERLMVNNKDDREFLFWNYRSDSRLLEFGVLKTIIFALKASLLGQIFVLRTSNFREGNYQPIVPRQKLAIA